MKPKQARYTWTMILLFIVLFWAIVCGCLAEASGISLADVDRWLRQVFNA